MAAIPSQLLETLFLFFHEEKNICFAFMQAYTHATWARLMPLKV